MRFRALEASSNAGLQSHINLDLDEAIENKYLPIKPIFVAETYERWLAKDINQG